MSTVSATTFRIESGDSIKNVFSPNIQGLRTTNYVQNGEPQAYKGKLRDGIGKVFIYLDYGKGTTANPGVGRYESLIVKAVNNWMYTGYGANPFYASYVSGNNGSYIDMHGYSASYGWPNQNAPIADTRYYRVNGTYYYLSELDSNNWYYNIIRVNDTFVRQDSYSNASAQGTFAHEIGHRFGFKENNSDGRSIMSQDWARSKISGSNQIHYTVGKMDHDALNRKH